MAIYRLRTRTGVVGLVSLLFIPYSMDRSILYFGLRADLYFLACTDSALYYVNLAETGSYTECDTVELKASS